MQVRQAVVAAATEACKPGHEIAQQLGLNVVEVERRGLQRDERLWVFAAKPKRDEGDDGGLFGAMEEED